MHGDFEPIEEYAGDSIRIDRLIEFLPTEHWSWDETGEIYLDDISVAIHEAVTEISEPYGDTLEHPVFERKSRKWHIGRIIYFSRLRQWRLAVLLPQVSIASPRNRTYTSQCIRLPIYHSLSVFNDFGETVRADCKRLSAPCQHNSVPFAV